MVNQKDPQAEERHTLEALEQFAGEDASAAAAAFDWLFPRTERYLYHVYKTTALQNEDIADLIQEVRIRAWERRRTFRNLGFAAWLGWLRRIARNLMLDFLDKRGSEVIPDWPWEEEEDLQLLDMLDQSVGKELFYLADVIWLELEATLTPEENHCRLLAAQLYYLDHWSSEEILALFTHREPDKQPLTRSQLDSWLTATGTLRYLAFNELCYHPERLTAHLLGCSNMVSAAMLDAILMEATSHPDKACPFRDWSWEETQAIIWRYFRGVEAHVIENHLHIGLTAEQLQALYVRCSAQFPFIDKIKALRAWLDGLFAVGVDRNHILREPELWQRLVFEYRYRYELPIREIYERIAPAAKQIGYIISLEMLMVWLSGNRLLKRLQRYYMDKERRIEALA